MDEQQNMAPPEGQVSVSGEKQVRTWSMICHLSALVMFLGLPFGNILGPLAVWLVKKNESPAIDENGKEALNFQISITIYALVASILIFIVVGIFLLIALAIADLVLVIMAAVKISNGQSYKYPYTIRLIK